MLKSKFVTVLLLVAFGAPLCAQVDYNRQYFNAKQLFREGKYNLAMESFKTLIPYDQNNRYSEYASFFYALSAYHQGFRAVAKDQLNQLKTLHPQWDKIEEVNFWLGRIYLDNRDYFQAIKIFGSLKDKTMQAEADALKAKALASVNDVETLKMMHEEFPRDEVVGKLLVNVLARNISNAEDKALLDQLISTYKLNRQDYVADVPRKVTRDTYSVSMLMPFMINTLDASPSKKRNQLILDFYEGAKLAVDTLAHLGINISLRAYDTERDPKKIESLLQSEELKNTDLLVGPFFPEENKLLQEFSKQQRINLINPFLTNQETVGDNPYGLLFQPTWEVMGRKSGEFLSHYPLNKRTVVVFYGTSRRDSVLAANFVQTARANGLRVLSTHRITKEGVGAIMKTLATPTEFDEYKFPKQFTLRKDSLGSVYVASDDPLIYTKVVNGVETRGDRAVILGSEAWLSQPALDLDKYSKLPIILASPNFINPDNSAYKTFVHQYIRRHGQAPSEHAAQGYEFMILFARQLKEHGVYFLEALTQQTQVPGVMREGYNFQFSKSNQLIPFVGFEEGQRKVLDKR